MKEWIMNWVNKRVMKYSESVELSIGKVYLRGLKNGMTNKCRVKACIAGDLINNPLFFQLMDYEVSSLTKNEIDSLSVQDGDKLRNAIRNKMLKAGVLKIEGTSNKDFSAEDIQVMDKLKAESKKDLEKLYAETGHQSPGVDVHG